MSDIHATNRCPTCAGSGDHPMAGVPCPSCGGSGLAKWEWHNISNGYQVDSPTLRYRFDTKLDFSAGTAEFITSRTDLRGIMREVSRELLDTKDKMVREALIELGWTPPPEDL